MGGVLFGPGLRAVGAAALSAGVWTMAKAKSGKGGNKSQRSPERRPKARPARVRAKSKTVVSEVTPLFAEEEDTASPFEPVAPTSKDAATDGHSASGETDPVELSGASSSSGRSASSSGDDRQGANGPKARRSARVKASDVLESLPWEEWRGRLATGVGFSLVVVGQWLSRAGTNLAGGERGDAQARSASREL